MMKKVLLFDVVKSTGLCLKLPDQSVCKVCDFPDLFWMSEWDEESEWRMNLHSAVTPILIRVMFSILVYTSVGWPSSTKWERTWTCVDVR